MSSTPPLATTERAALAELLRRRGPDAPTLCEGWNTTDLASHLVARERRPDAAPGFVVGALAGHSERVRRSYAARPYDELVELVGSGAPKWSPFGLPKLDEALNTAEFFVHHEDVRRAQEGWSARPLSRAHQDELWQALAVRAKIAFRKVDCGVLLQRSDVPATEATGNTAITARPGQPRAIVTGEPQELLLFSYGRRAHSDVKITGPAEARSLLATLRLDA